MKVSIINVVKRVRNGTVQGYVIQNFGGTEKECYLKAMSINSVNSNRLDIAVVEEVCGGSDVLRVGMRPLLKFPRVCGCCGEGMKEGMVQGGHDTYCDVDCLVLENQRLTPLYSEKDWEWECKESENECYETEWEELEKEGFYTKEGEWVNTDVNDHLAILTLGAKLMEGE